MTTNLSGMFKHESVLVFLCIEYQTSFKLLSFPLSESFSPYFPPVAQSPPGTALIFTRAQSQTPTAECMCVC